MRAARAWIRMALRLDPFAQDGPAAAQQPLAMTDDLTKVAQAAAVTGPDTPEAVKVSLRDDRMTVWMRNLAGPAICGMIAGVISLLAFGGRKEGFRPLWTSASELVRAHYVGGIGIALALMLGLLIWRLVGGRPSRIEVKAGPGSVLIEGAESSRS